MDTRTVHVGQCQFDLQAQVGYRMGTRFSMRPKMWSLLLALLDKPNALVTTKALLAKVWPNQDMNPRVLTNLVHQLRVALGPLPSGDPVIQVIPRRGYLLVMAPSMDAERPGTAERPGPALRSVATSVVPDTPQARSSSTLAPGAGAWAEVQSEPKAVREGVLLVGRTQEIASLQACLETACAGGHSVCWLLGEAGLGKTTLIQHLFAGIQQTHVLVLMCRCLDLPFEDEPFSPLVNALNEQLPRFVRDDPSLLDVMRQKTPCWLLQMPALIDEVERASLKASLNGSGPGRMLREGLVLLQHLASRSPVLLVMEDAQWIERASASLVDQLVREMPRGLMLLVSARPEPSRLMQTLSASLVRAGEPRDCEILSLQPLTLAEIVHYLEQTIAAPGSAQSLAQPVFEFSGGHPLFLSLVVAALQDQMRQGSSLTAADVLLKAGGAADGPPNRLNELVRMRTLTLDRQALRVLDVASCIPDAFVVPLLAKVLGLPEDTVAASCEAIVERGLFRVRNRLAPWPDGRLTVAYEFTHSLVRLAHHRSLAPEDVKRLHELIAGEILGTFLGNLSGMLGTLSTVSREASMREELALVHQARAQLAYMRFAPHQAREALQGAIEQYELMPVSARTRILRIGLLHELHQLLMIEKGLMHPEVEALRLKVIDVGADDPDPTIGFYVAHARVTQTLYAGNAPAARKMADAVLEAAYRCGTPARPDVIKQASSRLWMGLCAISDGDLNAGVDCFDEALALTAPPHPGAKTQAHFYSRVHRNWTLALSGRLAQPMNQLGLYSETAKLGLNPPALLLTLFWSGDALRHMGQFKAAQRNFEELEQLSEWYDCHVFSFELRLGLEACKPAAERSIPLLESMLAEPGRERSWSRPVHVNYLCETALARRDQVLAQRYLAELELIARRWGFYRVDLLRMKAELAWLRARRADAERLLNEALKIARDSGYAMATRRCLATFREPLVRGDLTHQTADFLLTENLRLRTQLGALQYPDLPEPVVAAARRSR